MNSAVFAVGKNGPREYNLKMIIAIGMRVKSSAATAFRVWANNIIQEYMVKGFTLNDEKLINNA